MNTAVVHLHGPLRREICFAVCPLLLPGADGLSIDATTGSMAAGATGSVDELFDNIVDEFFDDCQLLDELFDEPSSE